MHEVIEDQNPNISDFIGHRTSYHLSHAEPGSREVKGLSDVQALKRQLSHMYGLPPRFRQRLFSGGTALDDAGLTVEVPTK